MMIENFDDIYQKYHRFSVKAAFRIVKDPSLAEDISQEVFYHLYEIRKTLDTSDERKLRALILAATINKTKDYFKKPCRKREACILDHEKFPESCAGGPSPETELLCKEDMEYHQRALEKLRDKNPLNYDLLVRIKVLETPSASVAEEYGMTRYCIQSRIHRSRKWMRKEVERLRKKPSK